MNVNDSTPKSQSSTSFDLSSLKQRRSQYKSFRKIFVGNNSEMGHDVLDKLNQIKLTANPEHSRSDRSYSPLSSARNIRNLLSSSVNQANPIPGRGKSTSLEYNSLRNRMTSEPAEITRLLTSPKATYAPSGSVIELTPRKSDLHKSHGPESLQYLNRQEWFDNTESDTSNAQRNKTIHMTPEGKRYKTPSIFQKDLMSYRAAKQTIQNPVEAEYYGTRLNNSLREGSKSLDPNKVSGNYGFDSEVPKTGMGDNERKGLFSDLERFYRKNNLEVLEEDESPPSDDLEYKKSSKLFKLSLDERVGRKDQPKKGQDMIEPQLRKREVGINKTQEKNIASNLEALIKKAPLSQFQNEKTEQSKVDKRMTPEKLKSSSKGLKGDIKKEKESPEKSKATAPKETKKIENNERTPQKSQKMNKGEQVKQDSSPRFKKSSTTNETAPNPNPEPQNSASASPSKKLYLNNFSRPFPLVSPVLSSKNSPHGRPKAISAATTKRVNAGTPKGNEYKSIMAYKTVTKNTATIPSVASGGSTTYTGSFGESDNHVNTLTNENVGENQGKIEKVENIIHNNSHMLENKNLTGDFSQTWTAGSLEAAIQIKQKEVEALKALLEKESKGKIDLTPLRVDTNESEKNSQRKINEKESPVGKQATSTNITKENEVSTKKVFSGQIQGAYGSYALNQLKRTYGTIPIKHSLEKGPLQSKGTFDRLKDKTPPRQTRKNSGVSGLTTATTSTNTTTTIRKSSETGINVINVATAGIPANSKVKSPTNNHVMKGFKIQEPSKEHKSPGKESKDMKNKKAMSLQSKDLREMQLKKKTSKEVRSSKHSREWNVNEVKMMSTEKYTIAEPDCNTKHITHTEGYEQEFEAPLSGPNEGVNEKEIKDVEMVSDNPKAEINQEPQEKTEENTNGTPSRKNEGKTEVPGNGKASQRNRNQSNIKIPSSVLKTLGLTLNNRNVKSSLQLLMGETHKNKVIMRGIFGWIVLNALTIKTV